MGTSDVPKGGFYGYDGQGRECTKDQADGSESSPFFSRHYFLPANLHYQPTAFSILQYPHYRPHKYEEMKD
jgi:hypothetical protein